MVKVSLCFIVYMYIFIYVGNTCAIVTGSCLVYTVNKELGNDDPASASILDNWCRKWGSPSNKLVRKDPVVQLCSSW